MPRVWIKGSALRTALTMGWPSPGRGEKEGDCWETMTKMGNSRGSGGGMEERQSCGGVVRPCQVEAVWVSPSIPHSIIPTHIFTLSKAFTCAKVFPLGARLQFRG